MKASLNIVILNVGEYGGISLDIISPHKETMVRLPMSDEIGVRQNARQGAKGTARAE